jgi:GT2 family glycosyltransferase
MEDLLRQRAAVAICVATFRRPGQLAALLDSLGRLRFERVPPPDLRVIVADNEARGAAARVCAALPSGYPWPVRCHDEPRRGITYARNRCLAETAPDTEFVAFVDDDEVVDPGWLEALLLAQARHAAEIVTGPVVPELEVASAPGWVARGGFFRTRVHADGAQLQVAFTNNVLLRASVPKEIGPFDHRFALTGGEDTDFFMRANKAGLRIVWAADAVVREAVPASRATLAWLLRRNYREWGSHSRCEALHDPSLAVRAQRVLKAAALIAAGCVSLPFASMAGRHRAAKSLILVARGSGSFAGLLGRHYAEYADPASGS